MDRLNGLLGGDLDKASWNVSLSYYYGGITGGIPINTFLVEGDFIDLRPDLDATAIPKWPDQGPITRRPLRSRWTSNREQFTAAVRRSTIRTVATTLRDEWRDVLSAVHHQLDGDEDGRTLAHACRRQWPGGYDPDYMDTTWDSPGHHRASQDRRLHPQGGRRAFRLDDPGQAGERP